MTFFDDAGIIAINSHLFSTLEQLDPNADDGDLPVGDAVPILRFFFRLIDLGVDDALVQGSAIMGLIQANFPALHDSLTSEDFGVDPPVNARFNYSRFSINFQQLMVSL